VSASAQVVAGITVLERGIEACEAQERILAARGWRDDFLGDSLHEQYDTALNNGTVALVGGKHGGWVRCTAGVGNGDYGVLILGSVGAPEYYTLDIDYGWEQTWRMELDSVTNINAGALAFEWTNQYRIFCGLRTDIHATNWIIRCINAAGNSFTDTGVAADTDPHVHWMVAYPTLTGHRVDYFLDGALIGSHTTNIYNGFLHPMLWCVNRGGSGTDRIAEFDYWDVIPKVLA